MALLDEEWDRSIRINVNIPELSPYPIAALIDTGATDSFFNKRMLSARRRRSLAIHELSNPRQLFLLDGSQGESLDSYLPVIIKCEPVGPTVHMRLNETNLSASVQVILGMDFLDAVRPTFNWEERTLTYPSDLQADSQLDMPLSGLVEAEPIKLFQESNRHADTLLTVAETSMQWSPTLRDRHVDSTIFPTAPVQIALPSDGRTSDFLSTASYASIDSVPRPSHASVGTLPPTAELSALFDPDEEPDDVADILRIVPNSFHDFIDVFSKARAEKLPPHRPYDHSIDLIDPKDIPTVGPIYSTSAAEAQELKSQIDGLLANGFIRPSTAPLGAPVLFAKKKDGGLRMCIDYRQLNLRTKKNKYSLPPINFLLEQLSGAKIFSKIDLRGAYHLLRIAEGEEWKTTFRSRYGSFEFLVMPFGLTNAPSVFQHYVNDVFREHLDKFVIAYLDDILIFSNNVAEHDSHVRIVLECLRKHQLYAKATKCAFRLEETEFLGCIVGKNGLRMDPSKVQTILDWPIPSSVKAVQSFLGFANFYRRFIRDYSKVVSPLTALTKKDNTYSWTEKCQKAFDLLKDRFTSAPILVHFNLEAPTYLETDASDYAIGTILSQEGSDGFLHPIAFDSRKLLPAELNYEIHDKELLAIVWAFKRWRSMLLSTEKTISVLTDHQALTYFMTNKQLTRRQVRWAEVLADYNFAITYRPGKQSDKPDALSRRDDVYPSGGDATYANNNPHNFITLLKEKNVAGFLCTSHAAFGDAADSFVAALLNAQQADSDLEEHFDHVDDPEATYKPSLRQDKVLLLNDRIAVPSDDAIKLRILRQKHDHPTAGHPGRTKTMQLIARDYHWPGAKKDVADYIDSCVRCAKNKTPRQKPYGPLQPLPIPERPWSSLSMDFIDQLPKSGGFDSILVVVCRFTKMAVFIPTVITATSTDLADSYVQNVWSKHGLPDDIVSDRGSKFVSKFWRALCERLSIDRKVSTAYHPQTDGQTERVNQSLEQYIRIYCAYQQDDWHHWLSLAEFAYNNSDHTSTGVSPFKANYGYDPTMEVEHGASAAEPGNHFAYQLADLHNRMKQTIVSAQEAQRRFADRRRQDAPAYNVNDLVMLSTKNLRLDRPTRKFSERYIGPYRISQKITDVAFRLTLPADLSRLHPVFHVSLLRPMPKSELEGRVIPPPGPIGLEEDKYEVKAIVDSRIRGKQLQYRVQWKGYEGHQQEYTWEPAENLHELTDTLDTYHAKYPDKASPTDLQQMPTRPSRRRLH